MNVHIEWQEPIRLKYNDSGYESGFLTDVPEVPGIYIFSRKYGSQATPIYIGQATNLRTRLKHQLNNLKLINAVKNYGAVPIDNIPPLNGARLLYIGYLSPSPGVSNTKARLQLAEKAIIEYALAEGYPIINIKGTQIRHHCIYSSGAALEHGLLTEKIFKREN